MRVCEVLSNTCFLAWGRRWINISYQTNWFWDIIGRQFDTKLCDIFCVVHGIIVSLANVVILSCFRGSWKTGPESHEKWCVKVEGTAMGSLKNYGTAMRDIRWWAPSLFDVWTMWVCVKCNQTLTVYRAIVFIMLHIFYCSSPRSMRVNYTCRNNLSVTRWGKSWLNIRCQTKWFWESLERICVTKLCNIPWLVHGIIVSLSNVVMMSYFRTFGHCWHSDLLIEL